jgi:hypothetical protein
VDPEVELWNGDDGYFLKVRLNVNLPGIDRDTGESIVRAHKRHARTRKRRAEISMSP